MKVTFRWLAYEGSNKVWEEVIFRHWADHVPRKTEVIALDWFKRGKSERHKGVVEEVFWALSLSEGGFTTTSVVIQLGRMN
jgi:hypothetical protein